MSRAGTTYEKHNEAVMEEVVDKIKMGIYSVREAARVSGIPRSTLSDRVNALGGMSGRGRKQILTPEEEARLVFFLRDMERRR
jgi:transposase